MAQATYPPSELQLLDYAERLFEPLIREGVFENFERAFRALLLDYVERQIAAYREKAGLFEARAQQSFEAFTASLQGRATPDEEEEWLDWEAALIFLRKWQQIHKQIASKGSA